MDSFEQFNRYYTIHQEAQEEIENKIQKELETLEVLKPHMGVEAYKVAQASIIVKGVAAIDSLKKVEAKFNSTPESRFGSGKKENRKRFSPRQDEVIMILIRLAKGTSMQTSERVKWVPLQALVNEYKGKGMYYLYNNVLPRLLEMGEIIARDVIDENGFNVPLFSLAPTYDAVVS